MKWKGRRQSKNIEDRTDEIPPQIPDGTKLANGDIYVRPKGKTIKVSPDIEFNPDDETEMGVIRDLARRNARGTTPTPTPRPSSKATKIQVTPGKWKTK